VPKGTPFRIDEPVRDHHQQLKKHAPTVTWETRVVMILLLLPRRCDDDDDDGDYNDIEQ